MRQSCLLCERASPNQNLYCQESYCPAEMSPVVLEGGDWLGDIEVLKPIAVLRTAVLYEAQRHGARALLKVAHPGPEYRERLKREAEFLRQIDRSAGGAAHLPALLPPYANTTVQRDPYGKVVLRGHLLYYCLFTWFAGETLRDMVTSRGQLWVYHSGWIVSALAAAVALLQASSKFHLALSPDCVLVHLDDGPAAPQVLLWDLGVASSRNGLAAAWSPLCVAPAYTAPELIDAGLPSPSYAADVYGLGLTLYELLVGEPAYPYKLFRDEEVYDAVRAGRRVEMSRNDDVRAAAAIALRATDPAPSARYESAAALAGALHEIFGQPPRRRRPIGRQVLLLVAIAAVAIVLLIVAA